MGGQEEPEEQERLAGPSKSRLGTAFWKQSEITGRTRTLSSLGAMNQGTYPECLSLVLDALCPYEKLIYLSKKKKTLLSPRSRPTLYPKIPLPGLSLEFPAGIQTVRPQGSGYY